MRAILIMVLLQFLAPALVLVWALVLVLPVVLLWVQVLRASAQVLLLVLVLVWALVLVLLVVLLEVQVLEPRLRFLRRRFCETTAEEATGTDGLSALKWSYGTKASTDRSSCAMSGRGQRSGAGGLTRACSHSTGGQLTLVSTPR